MVYYRCVPLKLKRLIPRKFPGFGRFFARQMYNLRRQFRRNSMYGDSFLIDVPVIIMELLLEYRKKPQNPIMVVISPAPSPMRRVG